MPEEHVRAVDSEGLVYITHQGIGKVVDTVLVFDPKGKFVRSFGQDWHGGGHGIEIRKEGSDEFIYLSNTWTPKQKLVKTTLTGKVVDRIKGGVVVDVGVRAFLPGSQYDLRPTPNLDALAGQDV